MTLAAATGAYGLKDSKIWSHDGSQYSATGTDIPKVIQVAWGPVVGGKKLEGDDAEELYSFIKGYKGKVAFNKISLDVLKAIFGGTITYSGTTPNQKVTYTYPDFGANTPLFKIAGQVTKVDSGLGDAIVTLVGCKIEPGDYTAEVKYDDFASLTIDFAMTSVPTLEFNETATTIAASPDTTAPTVDTTVPADAATAIVVSADLTATFSEAIQSGDVNSRNFVLMKASDGTVVAGALSLGTADTVVTFNPTSNLTAATAYIWVIAGGIRDTAGNVLQSPVIVNFTTA